MQTVLRKIASFSLDSKLIMKKTLSEVGFEPTPPMETRNLVRCYSASYSLESGALDRSAILTADQMPGKWNYKPYILFKFLKNL